MEKKEYIKPGIACFKVQPMKIICSTVDETPVDKEHVHAKRSILDYDDYWED